MRQHVIHLHPGAPDKPAPGQACNGCGVCCAWAPCPLGVLVSGHRQGACSALIWHQPTQRYGCAMVTAPERVWPALPRWLRPLLRRLARRWIAAGIGCDSDLQTDDYPDTLSAAGQP